VTTTVEQIKGARVLLGWSQERLAAEADIHTRTVRNFEGGKGRPLMRILQMMQRALEDAGVEFTNGSGPGVQMRKPK
jgi:transcriptional regulator with XRE-family HTH domain